MSYFDLIKQIDQIFLEKCKIGKNLEIPTKIKSIVEGYQGIVKLFYGEFSGSIDL
jgi:hypothetical protein